MTEKTINVDYLARVEGEGALRLNISGDQVSGVELNIFEPPRFFEAFLVGRGYAEVVDIVARVCGICPIAYQLTASRALEKAFGVDVPQGVQALRRLIYCGEWIESHALHVYLLHSPDFLGYESAIEMATNAELRPIVERGLRMKKIGNRLMEVIGGREIHPVSLCVGGFSRAPSREELEALLPDLEWGLQAAIDTVHWAGGLNYPNFEVDYEFVALSHPDEYAITEGRVRSSEGLDIPVEDYELHFQEQHVAHSNALHSRRIETGTSYLVGPLARLNLNFAQLSPAVQSLAAEIGVSLPVRNPFYSLVARCLEVAQAFLESITLIRDYVRPSPSRAQIPALQGPVSGAHITEAPRGLIFHRYVVGSDGLVVEARIVPPTSQNQSRIEADLKEYVPGLLSLSLEEMTLKCEQLIRSYDPCISCATHFLNLEIRR